MQEEYKKDFLDRLRRVEYEKRVAVKYAKARLAKETDKERKKQGRVAVDQIEAAYEDAKAFADFVAEHEA